MNTIIPTPTVFLDTNVLKFSSTPWPPPLPKIDLESTLKKEIDLLEQIAWLVEGKQIKAVMQMEADFESWGLPKMIGGGGFYGAPIEEVDAPIKYGRILIGAGFDSKDLQLKFLAGIKNERFIELQKITGAFQGDNKYCLNQLLDAFHIWCAEHNRCDYFLTLDFKLIRLVSNHKLKPIMPILVQPSQLLQALTLLSTKQIMNVNLK